MTAFFTGTARKIALALTFAASLSALSSTSSFAFSAEAQEMCTGDAFRLCSSEIPNIPKITACMIKHRSDLSSSCRTVMDRDLAAKGRKVAVQELAVRLQSPDKRLRPATQAFSASCSPDGYSVGVPFQPSLPCFKAL